MEMQQQTMQPLSSSSSMPNDQQNAQPSEEAGEPQGEFTINSKQIENGIKEHMDAKQISALDRVLKAGDELMFGEDTHYKIMDGLKDSQDIGGDLGKGAVNLSMLLLQQSGNTLPGDVIIPAGVILIAEAMEYLNKTGMTPVTDEDFDEATHVFSVMLMNKLDPNFQSKMKEGMGDQQAAQPMQQAQGGQQVQGGGLLNMTGQTGA